MYVGHAFLPLAVVGLLAARSSLDRRQAVAAGAIAAGFGLLPDVDLVYTAYAVVRAGPTNVFPTTEHVWTESWVVHRTLTHSLLLGAIAVAIAVASALAFRAASRSRHAPPWRPESASRAALTPSASWPVGNARRRSSGLTDWRVPDQPVLLGLGGAAAGTAGLLVLGADSAGNLGATVVTLFAVGAVVLAWLGVRWRLAPSWIGVAAAAGVGLHAPGDTWMGRPPVPFFPLSTVPFPAVDFVGDPTLDFVAAVLVEVLLLCAAVAAAQRALDRPIAGAVSGWIALGALQCVALLVVDPPTFQVAYRFSALLLVVAAIAAAVAAATASPPGHRSAARPADRALTGIGAAAGAMLVGLVTYAVGYGVLV